MNRKTAGRAVSKTEPIVIKPVSRTKKVIPTFVPISPPSHIFLGHLSHFTAIVTVIQVIWFGYASVASAGILTRFTILLHPGRCPAWHPVVIGLLFTCCIGQGIILRRRPLNGQDSKK